jgi:hypothetical protein
MNLKGLAIFSILLMALIVAPQAADDFHNFVAGLEVSAHNAFLRAIIDSRTSGGSGAETTESGDRGPTMCQMQPQPETRVPAKRKAVRAGSRPFAPAFVAKVEKAEKSDSHFAMTIADLTKATPAKPAVVSDPLPSAERAELEQLAVIIGRSPFVRAEQTKLLNDQTVQRMIRLALCQKNRTLKDMHRPAAVPVKAAWYFSEPSPRVEPAPATPVVETEISDQDRIDATATSE